MTAYRVLIGLDYAGKRAEPGDIVNDLPPKSVGWLTAQGCVEKVTDGSKSAEPVAQPPKPAPQPDATLKNRERKSPTAKEDD